METTAALLHVTITFIVFKYLSLTKLTKQDLHLWSISLVFWTYKLQLDAIDDRPQAEDERGEAGKDDQRIKGHEEIVVLVSCKTRDKHCRWVLMRTVFDILQFEMGAVVFSLIVKVAKWFQHAPCWLLKFSIDWVYTEFSLKLTCSFHIPVSAFIDSDVVFNINFYLSTVCTIVKHDLCDKKKITEKLITHFSFSISQ